MMDNKKQLVVVMSRNYSTGLSVIRSLGRAGYTVDLVASAAENGKSELAACSKYVRNAVEIVSRKVTREGDAPLVSELLKYKGAYDEKPVLFPTDDYTASVVDLNRDILEDIFHIPSIADAPAGELTRLMNKSVQREIAMKVGLPVPDEWVISLSTDNVEIPEDVVYPCFCKPSESITGYKQEMKRCETREELSEHLTYLKDRFSDRDIIVQEFMNIDREIALEGLCFDQEIIVPGILINGIVGEYEKGVPVDGIMAPYEELGEAGPKLMDFLKAFRYSGMINLGVFDVGGKIYFNELNLRSGGMNFTYIESGVNLPDIFVKKVLGKAYTEEDITLSSYGKKFFYENVGWEDYLHGFLSLEKLEECQHSADIPFICNDYDPMPGKVFMKGVERRNFLKERKDRCINKAMETVGWTYDEAAKNIADARKRLGISYDDYRRNGFALIPVEEQEEKYREVVEKNGQKKEEKRLKEEALIRNIPKENKDTLVVVLSRNYSTGLAVIRSLGTQGFKVDLVASAIKPGRSQLAACSKYVNESSEAVSKKVKSGDDVELVGALLDYKGRYNYKPVLFPTDDYTASIMDMNRKALQDIFVMPTIVGEDNDGCMTRSMDKTFQEALAYKAGLKTPEEWIISLREDIDIPKDVIYPCFCKPIESITGYKQEMARCDSEEELFEHLSTLKSRFSERSVLVQEFLEIDTEIDFSGVCLDQEIILPAIVRKTNVAQYEKGVTLAGKVVSADELGEIKKNVIEMLKSFHYYGMFDMELNVVGDDIYFNEVNLRSGGPNFSYFMSGVNLPKLFVDEALGRGHKPEDEEVTQLGKSFIYEKVAWDDHINGFMTKRELRKAIAEADIKLLYSDDDPEPGKYFVNEVKRKQRRRKLKKIYTPVRGFISNTKAWLLGYPQMKARNRRNPDSPYPRVIVAGRNYCSNLSIARALGEGGFEVEVLRIFQTKPNIKNPLRKGLRPDAYSKYIKAYHICMARRKSKRILKKLIEIADPARKQLLIPADDLVAYTADEYYDDLKEYYLLPTAGEGQGGIIRLMNKDIQKGLATAAGLPVVNSNVIKTVEGEYSIPEGVTYPCFIKPNISRNSSKSRMRRCDCRQELEAYLEEYSAKKDIEILVEDFVDIKREYSLLGVSTKNGSIGPAFFGAAIGGQAEHRGVAVTGEILNCDDYRPLVDNMIKFVDSLEYDGLYDIDLVETQDGTIYFVEINMRFGASGYAFAKCGANMPAMYARYMFDGTPLDMNCKVDSIGKTFVSEKVLIEEYMMGRLSKAERKEILANTDISFVRNEGDRRAYRHFRHYYPVATIMRRLLAIKAKKKADAEDN